MADTTENAPLHRCFLRPRDQRTVAVLTLLGLVATVFHGLLAGGRDHPLTGAEALPRRAAEFRVDVNTASWPELTLLPRIGETLSQRIVDTRDAGGPFVDGDDLRHRVRGIGPKTLARMQPYLRPFSYARIEGELSASRIGRLPARP